MPERDRLIRDPQTHPVEGGRGSDVVDYASEEAFTYSYTDITEAVCDSSDDEVCLLLVAIK